jgi:hypothetical protein
MRWWLHLMGMALALAAAAGLSFAAGGASLSLFEHVASNYVLMGGLMGVGSVIMWFVTGLFGSWHQEAMRLQNEAFRDSVEHLVKQLDAPNINPAHPAGEVLAKIDESALVPSVLETYESSQGFFERAVRTAITVSDVGAEQAKVLDADIQKFLNAVRGWYGENASKVGRCNRLVQQWRIGAVEPSLKVIQRTAQQWGEIVTKLY